jgi:PAS domain S-box-containing protein
LPLLEAILKASPVAVVALDTEDRVMLWSDSAERMFGWLRAEVQGRLLPILPAESEAQLGRLRSGDTNHQGRETVGIHRDGTLIPVRIWTAPLGDGTGYLSMLADLSEMKQAERENAQLAGREQQARESAVAAYRSSLLFDAAPDAILEIDDGGRILLANTEAESMFQRSKEELQGLPVETLVPERFRGRHLGLRAN